MFEEGQFVYVRLMGDHHDARRLAKILKVGYVGTTLCEVSLVLLKSLSNQKITRDQLDSNTCEVFAIEDPLVANLALARCIARFNGKLSEAERQLKEEQEKLKRFNVLRDQFADVYFGGILWPEKVKDNMQPF
jgi:hypothetical protein